MATALQTLACYDETEGTLWAAVKAPFVALRLTSSYESMFFFAYILLLAIWLILYYLAPICTLNSSNGIRQGYIVTLSTVILWSLLIAVFVLWFRKGACEARAELDKTLTRNRKLPLFLKSAVNRVRSDARTANVQVRDD